MIRKMTLNELTKNIANSELGQKSEDIQVKTKNGTKTFKGSFPTMKLTAKRQREIFGFAIFGKKTIQYNENSFNTFFNHQFDREISLENVLSNINKKSKI